MGVKYTEKYGKSSIVASINDELPGFTIGIRADMDALPINEMNDVEYKSRHEGKMHACGHDAHTAILLGTVKALSKIKNKIKCRVVFLFQPLEEGMGSGAKLMVEDGVMDDIDVIVALHVYNLLDTGKAGFMPGPVMASNHVFSIELFGKSGHAAMPHTAVDAISMGVQIYSQVQLVLTREIDPREKYTLNVGIFQGGKACNVVADYAMLSGTVRTYSDELAEYILKRLGDITRGVVSGAGGKYNLVLKKQLPVVINDKKVTGAIMKSAEKVLGKGNTVILDKPSMGSEDFAFYLQKKPGSFFRLGTGNKSKGITSDWHSSTFDIDEDALEYGARIFVQIVMDHMDGI